MSQPVVVWTLMFLIYSSMIGVLAYIVGFKRGRMKSLSVLRPTNNGGPPPANDEPAVRIVGRPALYPSREKYEAIEESLRKQMARFSKEDAAD